MFDVYRTVGLAEILPASGRLAAIARQHRNVEVHQRYDSELQTTVLELLSGNVHANHQHRLRLENRRDWRRRIWYRFRSRF